jgi:hypothetical protein
MSLSPKTHVVGENSDSIVEAVWAVHIEEGNDTPPPGLSSGFTSAAGYMSGLRRGGSVFIRRWLSSCRYTRGGKRRGHPPGSSAACGSVLRSLYL